jgi:hypothetical protein
MEDEYKFIELKKANGNKYKYRATLKNKKNNREKNINFGAKGYEDMTTHKDEKRKTAYLKRHQKTENWEDITTKGAWSRWLLWNKKTIKESLNDIKKKFFK